MGLFNNIFNKSKATQVQAVNEPQSKEVVLTQSMRTEQGNMQQLVKSIMYKMQRLPYSTFRKDLDTWASARAMGMNMQNPRRWKLVELYIDSMLDLHLSSVVEKKILKITNKKYKIVDASGEMNVDATNAIKKKWFRKIIRHAMEARIHGFSLIEIPGEKEITTVNLVDRRFVIPERSIFILNMGENMGFDYTNPYFQNTCLPVGESDDLGMLLSLSIYAILKKNAIGNWAEFVEIFGIPMRTAETPSFDANTKKQIEDMLENMGSAAWGLFPEGTKINVVETGKTDSYKVFDMFIERMNSEISKRVLGNTMTTDNGSSRSQGEVHERTEQEIELDDKAFIADMVNDQLIPLLIRRGYRLENMRFEWDDAENMELDVRSEVDLRISQMGFKLSKEYIENTYSVELDENQPEEKPEPEDKAKKKEQQVEAITYKDIQGRINQLYNV